MPSQHFAPDDGDGFVRREIMAVVLEHKKIECRDQAVGHVSRSQVNLFVPEGARQQTQIHDAGRLGEAESVGRRQSLVAVGALHEFVAEAGTPLRSEGGRLRDGFQTQAASVIAANFYGEGVIKSEGLADVEIETAGILGLDLVVNLLGIAGRRLFQNRGERGAGVFGVDIDAAAQNGLMADVAAGEIEAAFYRKMGCVFDLLGDDFAEDELLGEIFGTDDDEIRTRRSAGGEEAARLQSTEFWERESAVSAWSS